MSKPSRLLLENKPPVQQGDIIRDVEYLEYAIRVEGVVEFSTITFPWTIVLSQACDMDMDYKTRWAKHDAPSNDDKQLVSVLVAPMYNAKHVYEGSHLSELRLEMAKITEGKTPGKNVRQNCDPRYHYLSFGDGIPMPPLVIDFKHYFTVNAAILKDAKRDRFVGQLAPLHREQVSQRFAAFLARIGLP